MAVVKLVKNLIVLILFCAGMLHIKGMRTNNEAEPDTPDAHIMYDQRQSGKYNIHVVIKDVAIIEMDRNEISDQSYDEEYYYDEDNLTVKPFNVKTTTTSDKPIDFTADNKTTIPQIQTTISSAEIQSMETTSKASQDTPSSTLSANITATTHKEFNKTRSDGEFMTLFTTHRPAVDIKSRSKVEPLYAIEEPVLQSRHQVQDFNHGDISAQAQSRDSKIFKVKVHRTHRTPQITKQREQCLSYQYRDVRGNCRGKRASSGSILKHLFRMLVTLPFKQDEQQIDD